MEKLLSLAMKGGPVRECLQSFLKPWDLSIARGIFLEVEYREGSVEKKTDDARRQFINGFTANIRDQNYWMAYFRKHFTENPSLLPKRKSFKQVLKLGSAYFGWETPLEKVAVESATFRNRLEGAIEARHEKTVDKLLREVNGLEERREAWDVLVGTGCQAVQMVLETERKELLQDSNASNRFSKLHIAIILKQTEKIGLCTSDNLKAQDYRGMTPLHVAVLYGKEEDIRVLVEAGANLEAQNNHWGTPLHEAAINGKEEAIQIVREA